MTQTTFAKAPLPQALAQLIPALPASTDASTPRALPEKHILAPHLALGLSGPAAPTGAPVLPPLLAAPAQAAASLTAELGSAGWLAYVRATTRDLNRQNDLLEAQVHANFAVNGARSAELGTASAAYDKELETLARLEADADSAKKTAEQKAKEARSARQDVNDKKIEADRAERELTQLKHNRDSNDNQLKQARDELKDVESRLQTLTRQANTKSPEVIRAEEDVKRLENTVSGLRNKLDYIDNDIRRMRNSSAETQRQRQNAESRVNQLTAKANAIGGPERASTHSLALHGRVKNGTHSHSREFQPMIDAMNRAGSLPFISIMWAQNDAEGNLGVLALQAARSVGSEGGLREGWEKLQKLMAEKPASFGGLTQTMAKRLFDIITTESGAVDNAKALKQAQSEKNSLNSESQRASNELSRLSSTHSSVKTQLDRAAEELRQAKSNLAIAKNNQNTSDLSKFREQISALKEKINALSSKSLGLQNKVEEGQLAFDHASKARGTAQTRLKTLENEEGASLNRSKTRQTDAAAKQAQLRKQALDASMSSVQRSDTPRSATRPLDADPSLAAEAIDSLLANAQAGYATAVKEARQAAEEARAATVSRVQYASAAAGPGVDEASAQTEETARAASEATATLIDSSRAARASEAAQVSAQANWQQAKEANGLANAAKINTEMSIAGIENRIRLGESTLVQANAAVKDSAKVAAFADALEGKHSLRDALLGVGVLAAEADALVSIQEQMTSAQTALDERKRKEMNVGDLPTRIQAHRDLFSTTVTAALSASDTLAPEVNTVAKQALLLLESFNSIAFEQGKRDVFRRDSKMPVQLNIELQVKEEIGSFEDYWANNTTYGQRVAQRWKLGNTDVYLAKLKEWAEKIERVANDRYNELTAVWHFTDKGHDSRVESVRADFMDRVAAIKNNHATALVDLGKAADNMVLVQQARLDLLTEREALAKTTEALKVAQLDEALKAREILQVREAAAIAQEKEAQALVAQTQALARSKDAQLAELGALVDVARAHREAIETRLDALLTQQTDGSVALEAAELVKQRAELAVEQAEQREALAQSAKRAADSRAADLAAQTAAANESLAEKALALAQKAVEPTRKVGALTSDGEHIVGEGVELHALVAAAAEALTEARLERQKADQLAEQARQSKDDAAETAAAATARVHGRLTAVTAAAGALAKAAGNTELGAMAGIFEAAVHAEAQTLANLMTAQAEGLEATQRAKTARDALAIASQTLKEIRAQLKDADVFVLKAKTELRDARGDLARARDAVEKATAERNAAVESTAQIQMRVEQAIADAERATAVAIAQRKLATQLVDEVARMADEMKDLLSRHGVRLTELLQFIEELLALDTSGLLEAARAALLRSKAEAKQATKDREVVKRATRVETDEKQEVALAAMASPSQGRMPDTLEALGVLAGPVAGPQTDSVGLFFKRLQHVTQQIEAMNDEHFRQTAQPLKI